MARTISRRAAGIAAGLVVLVGAGGAIAASETGSDDFLADVAKRLGVSQAALEDAIVGARSARVDKALADGKITKEQAADLEKRLESGDLGPGFGPGFGGHHHLGHPGLGGLDAAASYLGVTEAALRESLADGKSLADVAKAGGKSLDGLKQAIVAEQKTHLDEAVENGRLTRAQADEIADRLADRVDELVTRTGFGGHRFPNGPPELGRSAQPAGIAY